MNGFTDIHSHCVYGMDDGAQTPEEMYAMLDAAFQDGITCLFATPHVVPGMQEFDTALFQKHLAEAKQYCESKQYALSLLAGAEILYTPQLAWYAEDHQLPVLEGSRSVLLEFSPRISLSDVQNALEVLEQNGYRPIIAHVERYACLGTARKLRKLKAQYDVRFQVNTSTVIRKASFLQQYRIKKWFAKGLVDFVASDAHNVKTRPFRMSEAYKKLVAQYGKDCANQITSGFAAESNH